VRLGTARCPTSCSEGLAPRRRGSAARCTNAVYYLYMLTNIDLDPHLVETAMELTGERTKRAVVRRALEELIRIERAKALRAARGTLRWRGDLGVMREKAASDGPARRYKRSD